MIYNELINTPTFKPVFSGHETFPLRYGWLKKTFDAAYNCEQTGKSISKDLFNNEESIGLFGVGKNMVTAMRHWGQVCGVFDADSKRDLKIDRFAAKLFIDDGLDPWMENPATLWYIHWNLASNPTLFTYYWFFNHWNGSAFDRDGIAQSLLSLSREYQWSNVSPLTVKRDVECFIRIYVSKTSRTTDFDEDNIESPLTELGLITPIRKRDLFQPRRGMRSSLSIYTFLFGLLRFWDSYSPHAKTLSLEAICYEPHSPGRIFLLDEDAIVNFATQLNDATKGTLSWSETAGLRQVVLNNEIQLKEQALKYLEKNYRSRK